MAESQPKDLSSALASSSSAPVVALVLILATTFGVLNLSPRPGGSAAVPGAASGTTGGSSSPKSTAAGGNGDALEALEPLLRFLNLDPAPGSLEDLAKAISGYRIITLIASVADPKDSRLGYDFDMATEAIQRSIESEGYTLDRFRFPWLDTGASSSASTAPSAPGQNPPPAAVAPGSPPATSSTNSLSLVRHERQPGTILYRIDRPPPAPGRPPPPQDLLLLLLVGETPTWGIQQQALKTSLDIAWTLDVKRNTNDPDHEPVVRILAPTFSGTADSLARAIRAWAAGTDDHHEARIWVSSGAATAVDKTSFERNTLPAKTVYSSTVIPDEILLEELYRFLANPADQKGASAAVLPEGKIALLMEGGSGYGAAVGNTYGTSGQSSQSRGIISIPFPSQIAQVRASASAGDDAGNTAAKSRITIPLDPPSGKQTDRLPTLSPKMTIATDRLILSTILTTIATEDIRYVGIVATDILDVIYLTRLIRENCPDVQVILVGNDLRYTDPQFTLDFRGTIIASSYPLDARAQIWAYPFEGAIERRMFASEYDVGRYNAGLVLLNAMSDPNHAGRLVVDPGRAEDFLVYGKPFVASSFDSINRRPQIWINQVGQFNIWPLKVLPLSQCQTDLRSKAENLIPPVSNLDPGTVATPQIRIEYDLPLFWKLVFAVATFLVFLLVGIILYTNLGAEYPLLSRSSWFDPLLKRFEVSSPEYSRKSLFLIALLLVAVGVPYCLLVSPLDLALPVYGESSGSEGAAQLIVNWDILALAALATLALLWLLLPLGMCLREVLRRRGTSPPSRVGEESAPIQHDRWLTGESTLYRILTVCLVGVGILCILLRLYRFAFLRPTMPNDWLTLDRSAHLLGGISPVVPIGCLGAAIFWWGYLELKRLHGYPLLRRGSDLISLQGVSLPSDFAWKRIIPRMNARFHLCIELLEYPVGILISKNLPLAGLVLSAVVGLVVFVWGVVWPRFIPTPEGRGFDLLVVVGFLCYLLLILYSQVRYLWLWRSLLQLFRQISLLPMAGAFDRIPPRVAAKFGRFLRTSLHDDIDLEIPLQQCRLVVGLDADATDGRIPARDALRAVVQARAARSDQERFEVVSDACVRPVVELAWPRRSLEDAYGGSIAGDGTKPVPVPPEADLDLLDPSSERWLALAEELLALRIVYLVSQFAAPLRSISAQLIYGPILLLLVVAWYPFHPQRLMAIMIWIFIVAGVLGTLAVLLQVERSDFVSRVSRTAPSVLKFDHNFLSNLLPYAVPVVGFVLTAFPSLSYWLGSLLEPIGRAVK
jgi:hypothetical protein